MDAILKIEEMPPLPEPDAWVSWNVLSQSERIGRLPVTSLQPGVYQYKHLFSSEAVHAYAKAYAAQRIASQADEIARLRVAEFAAQSAAGHLGALVDDLRAALDQALDDMGEVGLCVCQAAKDQMRAAIAQPPKEPT